jgi:hypothetical protein
VIRGATVIDVAKAKSKSAPLGREPVLAKVRALCLSFPGAIEKLSHGEPTWFTKERGRVFAMFDDHHHGAPHIALWIPSTHDAQEMLVAADPARYFVPPYVGVKGWIGVVLDTNPDWGALPQLVTDAHALVSTRRR